MGKHANFQQNYYRLLGSFDKRFLALMLFVNLGVVKIHVSKKVL